LPAALAGVIKDNDVIVTMGAGSIGALAHELPARLQAAASRPGAPALKSVRGPHRRRS